MGTRRFDAVIVLAVSAGVAVGAAAGWILVLAVVPEAATHRPAVLSTLVIPLGCFLGWVLSPSRERVATAAPVCFGLYFLSAFAAARLGTFFSEWDYFHTILWVQAGGGLALALALAAGGRALPEVERLRQAGDTAGLADLLLRPMARERWEAARALGELGEEEARLPLLEAIGDAEARVRRMALSALVGRASGEDVPRLELALADQDRAVRLQALEVLRWIEEQPADAAIAGYWRHVLSSEGGRFWLRALPLLTGGLLCLVGLLLPWGGDQAGTQGLWGLAGGVVVASLMTVSALLAPAELCWGVARRNLAGHLERMRVWVFLLPAGLALALLWPLEGAPLVGGAGQQGVGVGFWMALVGTVLQFAGAFFIRG